jgi:putative nucleotidyltransferase with HDIG domain
MPDIEACFPELASISDDALREGVRRAWETACADNGVEDLADVPWYPPVQHALDLPDEKLVPHVREVTAGVLGLADALSEGREPGIDRDLLVAGALVHDVSKLYETHGMEETRLGSLLGHPHFGVHVVTAAGLPVEIAHIVLSHTPLTSVEPAFLEAALVRRVDQAAAAAIEAEALDDLRKA